MGRRPRSRASRSERRMLKERAASALKHGLPVPTPPPARARVPEPLSSSSVPPSGGRASAAPNRRMPLAVKFLGIGLLLLGVIYGLTLFRDHRREADAALTPAESDTTSAVTTPMPLAPSSRPAVVELAPASPTKASLTAGLPSVGPSRLGAALHVPPARPLVSVQAATQPTASAPIARKASVIAALPSPSHAPASAPPPATANAAAAPALPNPAAPPAPTAAPAAHKVDNPY